MRHEDSSCARLRREVRHLLSSTLTCQTLVSQANMWLASRCRTADGHPETRRERLDRLLLQIILRQVVLCVVDRQSARGALRAAQERLYGNNGDAMVRSVDRVLEEEHGGPVIGKVIGHLACGAGCACAHISRHGDIEGVTADNVVQMRRRNGVGLDDGVETLEGQCRAWKPKSGINGGRGQ